ncbi:MAG: TfoX/Sxy family protein [Pseudomonadota bacterium]
MAYDERLYEALVERLGATPGLTEKKMFGGICFLLNGNMLAGVMRGGGMARVGKDREAEALELDGVVAFSATGRKMGGLVHFSADAMEDEAVIGPLLSLAFAFVGALPAK